MKANVKEEKIRFVEPQESNYSSWTLIEGFPGMGLVGTIAVKYLSEKLDFKENGFIESGMFLPVLRIHNGLPVHPARIYTSKKHRIILLISEQIIPQKQTYDLAKAVIEWINKKKITRVISLAGIRAPNAKEGMLFGIAANAQSKKTLKDWKVQLIDEGITTGITAFILLNLSKENVDAFSLLGNAKTDADYRAAADVIKKLDEMYPDFEIDVKPLLQEAKKTEEDILKHLQQLKEKVPGLDQVEKPSTPMYA
ncbi:proteasome assembly chaperone family protein [archaeon]|nr:proteasome assembly chaperone family protein [archaeon]